MNLHNKQHSIPSSVMYILKLGVFGDVKCLDIQHKKVIVLRRFEVYFFHLQNNNLSNTIQWAGCIIWLAVYDF